IDRRGITVIPVSLWHVIQGTLHRFFIDLEGNCPTEDTPSSPVNEGYNVGFVFLHSMKVWSSSISTPCTSSGCGAGGSWAACALPQFATLCGLTPNWRPVRRRLLPSTYLSTARRRSSSL